MGIFRALDLPIAVLEAHVIQIEYWLRPIIQQTNRPIRVSYTHIYVYRIIMIIIVIFAMLFFHSLFFISFYCVM